MAVAYLFDFYEIDACRLLRLGSPGSTQLRVWRRPENSSNVRIAKSGHLVSLCSRLP